MTINEKEFAKTHWTIDDIKGEKLAWTNKQCEEFLLEIEDKLAERMVAEGWNYINFKLSEKEE